jgi:hypothetical protein
MCSGRAHDPTSQFSSDLFLYVNLGAKGVNIAHNVFRSQAPAESRRVAIAGLPT